MDPLIEAIRVAVAEGATDDAKQAGATACRTILVALEARAGEPLTVDTTATAVPSGAPLAAAVSALRGVPPDQLLDLVIAKLRNLAPTGTTTEPVPRPGPRFTMVTVPRNAR